MYVDLFDALPTKKLQSFVPLHSNINEKIPMKLENWNPINCVMDDSNGEMVMFIVS